MPLRDQSTLETEPTEFAVQLSKPNVQVKWLKNGKEIPEDERVKVTSEGTLYKLLIDNTQVTDADKYTCVLPSGKSCDAKLTVEGLYNEIERF